MKLFIHRKTLMIWKNNGNSNIMYLYILFGEQKYINKKGEMLCKQ